MFQEQGNQKKSRHQTNSCSFGVPPSFRRTQYRQQAFFPPAPPLSGTASLKLLSQLRPWTPSNPGSRATSESLLVAYNFYNLRHALFFVTSVSLVPFSFRQPLTSN